MKYILVLLMLLGMAGCKDEIDTRPHAVHYGEDSCERCRMIISDKRFAAQYITSSGEARKFDDIGCMADDLKDAGKRGESPLAAYVADYGTGEWIDAEKASYLQNGELRSPMGYNIAAFGSAEAMSASTFYKDGKALGGFGELTN
ncbi:MAG: nitrous oxide reductase accessory protein NosL [Thermodesulfobacteriota bacterium]